jgi:signal transduction histidine kinase
MERVERLMRKTLSFARPYLPDMQRGKLEDVARGAVRELEAAGIRGDHRVEIEAEPDLPELEIDAHGLHEVLSNLVRNAIEAGGGRKMRVRIRVRGSKQPQGQEILVEDDGPGIPESTRRTLFDPFVTSKKDGTGLGLAVSRKIVEAHDGAIEVVAGELGGACFRVFLPEHREH